MTEPHYCDLCGCVCVVCAQLQDGCQSCELLYRELLLEASPFIEALIDHLESGGSANEG